MPAPPVIEPDAAPTVCVEINEQWASWLQGRVWNMEFMDWSEPWDDAARDRSSALADLIAAGNCSGGGTLDAQRKLIVDTVNRPLNSVPIVAVSPLDNIVITSADAGAKYRIVWSALLRGTASPLELNLYVFRDGVNLTAPWATSTWFAGLIRERFVMTLIDLSVPAGPHTYEIRYNKTSGGGTIEWSITGQQQVRMIEAYRVE